MKLHQLLCELQVQHVQRSNTNSLKYADPSKMLDHENPNHPPVYSTGMEAVVFSNPRPSMAGMVTKWIRGSRNAPNAEPTTLYLAAVQDQNNSLAPRVDKIKCISNGKDTYDYLIKMERLYPLTASMFDDAHTARQLLTQIIVDDDNIDKIEPLDIEDFGELLHNCCVYMSDYASLPDTDNKELKFKYTKNFKQIMSVLNNIVEETTARHDIHDGNLMVRHTSVGMQLVISDPLYGRPKS